MLFLVLTGSIALIVLLAVLLIPRVRRARISGAPALPAPEAITAGPAGDSPTTAADSCHDEAAAGPAAPDAAQPAEQSMPADTGTAPAADHAVPAPSAQDVAGDALPVPAELSEGAGMPAPGGFAPVPAHAGKTLPAGVLPAGNTIGDAATLPGAVSAPAGAGLPQPECRRDQSGTAQSAVSVPSFRKILRVAVVAVLVVAVLVVAVVALVVNFEHAREVAGRNGEDWRQWL